MKNLTIVKRNGGAYIDSREVAELIGKKHQHLLRDIRGYAKVMARGGLSNFGQSDFFIESDYINAQNKAMPCYLLSKMGCEFVAHKLTGDKGILFTATYVYRFNEMEKRERAAFESELETKAATPRLRVFNTAVKNVLSGFASTHSAPKHVYDFLSGAYKPFGIAVSARKNSDMMTATEIASILGIYSENDLPHAHAVAAIIDKLNIAPEHIEIAPYGLVGISVRYDEFVLDAVDDWLCERNYPRHIPYLDFEYHIYYAYATWTYEVEKEDDDWDDWDVG
jgi:Rha family phage regulatory protein